MKINDVHLKQDDDGEFLMESVSVTLTPFEAALIYRCVGHIRTCDLTESFGAQAAGAQSEISNIYRAFNAADENGILAYIPCWQNAVSVVP